MMTSKLFGTIMLLLAMVNIWAESDLALVWGCMVIAWINFTGSDIIKEIRKERDK